MSDISEHDAAEIKADAPVIEDCSNTDVVTKYRLAAEIAQSALEGVIGQLAPGKSVVELCAFGDAIITARAATVYKSKKVEKGIAFPTCVSVNEVVCHFSPLPNETTTIKAGDWVKIDLGCHIDGYIAVVAHTVIVPATEATTSSYGYCRDCRSPYRISNAGQLRESSAEHSVRANVAKKERLRFHEAQRQTLLERKAAARAAHAPSRTLVELSAKLRDEAINILRAKRDLEPVQVACPHCGWTMPPSAAHGHVQEPPPTGDRAHVGIDLASSFDHHS
ncbi:hypothetical protein SPRG_20806 [Saprolegnia parasitica CBS 223.65]|uniref:Peptidase M24 domain-containing protein n=1 Tax=Saprolegnia parasitica (strain CBS 223.65) TaxID=695850 RepID=A0A067C721_SAPPC|nr:hypothetical protein SPRG_20806 [Saprolegnia parasitica CBS 223.65]KDO24965.1 hypothetical protein SPRG_20806 [Saprolegnia parasitica CBS 223.65]|eukprot:XP_012204425.1 hypothetical protein SPRG_20806 [Saprolegnia parasitica CBS 223.65]